MCGRGVLGDLSWAQYREMLMLILTPDTPLTPRWNVAPTTQCPVLLRRPEGNIGAMARWGLIPHWFRKPLSEMKFSTFNARAEEAASKPVYRDALKAHRCLVPFIGYYEWTGPKGAKQPWYITVERNAPFLGLAGLWSEVEIDGYTGLTFTILTRAADPEIAHLHHRMPVIVDEVAWDDWLAAATGIDDIPRVDGTRLRAHRVGKAVGNVRNEGPDLIEEEQGTLL